MSQQIKKKYLKIIRVLEKAEAEHASDQRMEQLFKSELSREFRLEVTADATLEHVLRRYYDDCHSTYFGSQIYCEKLTFIDRINDLFYRIEFISRREYLKLREIILKEKNSPANKWLEDLPYLRACDSVDQFRYEFLSRYCNMPQEAVGELLEDGSSRSQLSQLYEDFFRRCLDEGVSGKVMGFIEDYFSKFEHKSQMLSPTLIRDLDRKLDVNAGENDNEMLLNKILQDVAQENSYVNDPEVQQRLEDQVKLIQKALQKFSGLNVIKNKGLELRLGKFGSLTSGFAGIDADLDLTILTNCYINQADFLKLLHEFLKKEYREDGRTGGRRVTVQLILQAKTPLIQLSIGERGRVDLKIDIIVNNILGVINSKFLKVYSQVKWIKNLGLLVKMWGKAKNLIGKNALSSYAMILMLIHYLIKTRRAKPIMDHRTTSNLPDFKFKRMKQNDVEQFRVYYSFNDNPADVSIEERVNYFKIFTGFMKYYSQEFWQQDEKNRIVTVDQSTDRSIDAECALTIKDPFDEPHNPGRLKVQSREFMIQKFKEAHEILKSGKQDKIRGLFIS